MSDVSRDEFDRLTKRVERIERSLTATIQLLAAEVVGLRTAMDERFDAVDQRFDAVDQRFDAVDQRFDTVYKMIGSEAARADERHDTTTATLGRIIDLLEGREP